MKAKEEQEFNGLESTCLKHIFLAKTPRLKSSEGHCTPSYSLHVSELKERRKHSICPYGGRYACKVSCLLTDDGKKVNLYAYTCEYQK